VSMYGVLRFHFGSIVDLRYHACTIAGAARSLIVYHETREVHLSIAPLKTLSIKVQHASI
jgi:hypothetical protein